MNKMILADELTAEVMIALNWQFDTAKDCLVDADGEVIEWTDFDSIVIAGPIEYKGTPYQQINVWGDGTLEFQDMVDGDSLNWNDFDEEFISKMYDAVKVYQVSERYDCNKDTYKSLLADCYSYADEEEDEEQMIAYKFELPGSEFSKANWHKLIESGVFHDAIGKVIADKEDCVIVVTEY